ncbi:MAG: ATP-binding protein [Planctomycetota bacterium]
MGLSSGNNLDEFKGIDVLPVPALLLDSKYNIKQSNTHWGRFSGLSHAGISMPLAMYLTKNSAELLFGVIERKLELEGEAVDVPVQLTCPDPNGSEALISITRLASGDQIAVLQNITAIQRKLGRLNAEVSRQRSLISRMPMTLFRYSMPNSRLEFISEAIERLAGIDALDLLNSKVSAFDDLVHSEDWPTLKRIRQEASDEQSTYRLPYRIITPDGQIKWVEEHGKPDKSRECIDGALVDVTDAKHTKKELEGSQDRLRAMLDGMQESVLLFEANGDDGSLRCTQANNEAGKLFDCQPSALIGRPLTGLIELDDKLATVFANVGSTSARWSGEIRGELVNGCKAEWLKAQVAEARKGILLTLLDVSENKLLHEQLQHSAKMEAVGRLAGGVAHDFNNILTAISGWAEILKWRHSDNEAATNIATKIAESSSRAAELTHQLLAFSRRGKMQLQRFDLRKAVYNVINLLSHTISANIELKKDLPDDPCLVRGDAGLLENAILNLAVNARDAMPDGGSLTFTISSRVLEKQELDAADNYLDGGEYYVLSVSDTGEGIPSDLLGHIFEPFFTTKSVGKGTGLGLAAVYGTCKSHHGMVNVHSDIGRGATFEMLLPTTEVAKEEIVLTDRAAISGRGKVLFVDDEKDIRDLGSQMLTILGYDVITESDGQRAANRYTDGDPGFDLVILDVQMPGISGIDVAREIRLKNQGVPIMFCTGGTLDADLNSLKPCIVQQKPFTVAELSQSVAEVLSVSRA